MRRPARSRLGIRRPLTAGIATIGLALASLAPAQALDGRTPLKAADVRAAFDGKTLEGFYPSGTTFVDRYGPNGRVDYSEPGTTVSGEWSVRGDALCTFYTNGSGGCFFVVRTSANCFEFYAAADHDAPSRERSDLDWTARGWLNDRPHTCDGVPTV